MYTNITELHVHVKYTCTWQVWVDLEMTCLCCVCCEDDVPTLVGWFWTIGLGHVHHLDDRQMEGGWMWIIGPCYVYLVGLVYIVKGMALA